MAKQTECPACEGDGIASEHVPELCGEGEDRACHVCGGSGVIPSGMVVLNITVLADMWRNGDRLTVMQRLEALPGDVALRALADVASYLMDDASPEESGRIAYDLITYNVSH